jgi:K319L-like, PKD domain
MHKIQPLVNYKTKKIVIGLAMVTWLITTIISLTASTAEAYSSYTTSFNAEYGTAGTNGGSTMGSCITCHVNSNGTGGYNSYGNDWKPGKNYSAIEGLDSDDDGYTNIDEILVDTFPGDASSKPAPVNDPPVADAGSDQTVNEGSTVTLDGSGSSDPDDGIASYLWAQTGGTSVTLSDTTAAKPTFTAPNFVSGANTLTFRLTVTDNGNQSISDTVTISISDLNQAPIADAGSDQTILEVGVTVTLDGSGSSDPDDGIVSYLWQQTAGSTINLSDDAAVEPTFVSPNVASGGESFRFTLTVTDASGDQDTDICIVIVTLDNLPPTADAGVDQTVNEGNTVFLDGSNSSDSDGTIAAYLWEQTAGKAVSLSNATTAEPAFTSPNVGQQGESLTFMLTVTDNQGLQGSDEVLITVGWQNEPPVADAGTDQTVTEGVTITLDASNSSDPDGVIASYHWVQTGAGQTITFKDPTTVQQELMAPPAGLSGEILTFELTVEDAQGQQSTDVVTVTIQDNGIIGFPEEAHTLISEGDGTPLGITADSGGRLDKLDTMDPATIPDTSDMPRNFPMGLIDVELISDIIGGTVSLTVYLSEPAPEGYHWYKYNGAAGVWTNYSEEIGENGKRGAVFNETRDQVTITLVDGGMGDDDGIANGIIIDPAGLATVSLGLAATGAIGSNDFGTSGGGCFIADVTDTGWTQSLTVGFLSALAMSMLACLTVAVIRPKSKRPKRI